MPHGSGFDAGCSIEAEQTFDDVVVISGSYHHMNEDGFYTHWSHFNAVVKPSFSCGMSIEVSGGGDEDHRDYVSETLYHALSSDECNHEGA